MDATPGDVLAGKYSLIAPLGVGGMGQVWTAQNLSTGAEVAAKVLLPSRLTSPEAVARFRREAHATAALSHRAIVRVFDLCELDPSRGELLLVMERLRGRTLAQHFERTGPMSVAEALAVVLPLLSGLEHAHALGIVHRDVKPENVFLAIDPDGHVMPKLLDFGISKMSRGGAPITGAHEVLGTLHYMSPEQALGDDVDARSDLFSLGVVLYECLTGKHPFLERDERGADAVLSALIRCQPRPIPRLPAQLWGVLRRTLHFRPEARFAGAAELADALRQAVPSCSLVTLDPCPTSVPSLAPQVLSQIQGPPQWRLWRALGTAAALAMAIGVGAGAARPAGREAAPARGHAEVVRTAAPKRLGRPIDVLRLPSYVREVAGPPHRGASVGQPRSSRSLRLLRDPGF